METAFVMAMTGLGMTNAADTTEAALTHFTSESGASINAAVFAGVAGGLIERPLLELCRSDAFDLEEYIRRRADMKVKIRE